MTSKGYVDDEARVKRLTELARRVWVDTSVTCVDGDVMACDAATYDGEYIRIARHPRAFDALEAALLVLAGEPPPDQRSPVIGNCGACGALVPAMPTAQRWWRYCRDCETDFGEPAAELLVARTTRACNEANND